MNATTSTSHTRLHKALITGGTRGIGWAIAQSLAPLCTEMYLTYHSDEGRAQEAQRLLRESHPDLKVIILHSDVSQEESARQLSEELIALEAIPSVMVFNAGVTNRRPLWEISEGEILDVFRGNLLFPINMIRLVAPRMPKGGVHIFTGSLMGVHPHSVSLTYGVTKSAVHALVENLVKHLSPLGQRVAAVAPGFVDTDWQLSKPKEIRDRIESKIALHRFASPQEVGEVFRMIVENEYFNGDIITLSGGYSYQ